MLQRCKDALKSCGVRDRNLWENKMRNPNKSCLHITPIFDLFKNQYQLLFFLCCWGWEQFGVLKKNFRASKADSRSKGCPSFCGIFWREYHVMLPCAGLQGGRSCILRKRDEKEKKRCEDGAFTAVKHSLHVKCLPVLALQNSNCFKRLNYLFRSGYCQSLPVSKYNERSWTHMALPALKKQ